MIIHEKITFSDVKSDRIRDYSGQYLKPQRDV